MTVFSGWPGAARIPLCVEKLIIGMRPQRQKFITKRLCQFVPGGPAGGNKHIHFRVRKRLQGGWRFGVAGGDVITCLCL